MALTFEDKKKVVKIVKEYFTSKNTPFEAMNDALKDESINDEEYKWVLNEFKFFVLLSALGGPVAGLKAYRESLIKQKKRENKEMKHEGVIN